MPSAEVAPVGSDGQIASYSSVAGVGADSGADDAVAGEPKARPAALHFDEELRLADVRKESLAPEDLVYEGLGLFEDREPEADADDAASSEPLAPQIVFRTAAAQLPVLALPHPSRGIAFQLWPSALALCRYIEQLAAGPEWSAAQCIVELGAGLGTVGLLAGVLGAPRVLLTDLPSVCEHMQRNIDVNVDVHPSLAGRVVAEALPWGPDSDELCRRLRDEVDLLVASDVVYWAILFEPLLHTMRTIMRPSVPGRPGSYLYMSHYRRRKQDKRFFVLARKFFIIDEVMSVPCDQLRTPITVLRFQLRPGCGLP